MKRIFSKCMIFLFTFVMAVTNTASIYAESITVEPIKYNNSGTGNADINIFEPGFDDGGQSARYPLSNYLTGSYYSTKENGCTCHSWCEWYSDCDCIEFDYSIQCDGFAKYIYYDSHNSHVTEASLIKKDMIMNVTSAKNTFMDTPVGTYIRVLTSSGVKHSIAITETDEYKIKIYHANVKLNKCDVKYEIISWEEFVNRYPHLLYYQT